MQTSMMPIERRRRKGQRLPDDNDTAADGIEAPRRTRKPSSRKTKAASTKSTKGRSLRTGVGLQYLKVTDTTGRSKETRASSREDHFESTGGGVMLAEARAQISQLQEQLVGLKVHNRDLEEELKNEKAKKNEDRYRKELERLEEENLDMQHDLAETRKIRNRLEKENRVIGKKLIKREAENVRLRDRIDTLSGRTGDESNAGRSNYDDDPHSEPTLERSVQKLERSSRRSLWKLLAEETVPESPVCSRSESRGSIFESLFKSSGTLTHSSTDLSLTPDSRSSHSRNDGRLPYSPRNDGTRTSFRYPQGGFVPAA